jgi:hypothetical protein
MLLRPSCIALIVAVGTLFFGTPSVSAAVPTSTLTSVVKLTVQNDQLKTISSGAGIVIDGDGHVLTSYQAVKAWEAFKKQPITICPTTDPFIEPRCTHQAVVIKLSQAHDLALLQIRSVQHNGSWMSIEEKQLRQPQALPFVRIHPTTTTELVELGEDLAIVGYPSTGGTTLTYTKSSVTGFVRKPNKTASLPWLLKTESKFTSTAIGGAAFTNEGVFVGMPTHTSGTKEALGHVITLPIIISFMKDALGADALLSTRTLLRAEPLVGVQNGDLRTSICPEFATYEGGTKSCRCRPGFYAIGSTCMLGQTYCSLRFPGNGTYDGFLKQCLCPNAKGGTSVCALPAPSTPKPAPAPTPAQLCTAKTNATWNAAKKSCDCKTGYRWNTGKTACEAIPKPVPPPSCPALATYNSSTKACVCSKPYSLNAKKDACIFIGKPSTIAQLQHCEFIGKTANKLYYPKGHSIIKQMTYLGKQCFATELDAQKAKFKRTTTK